jgi:hypothetical protein
MTTIRCRVCQHDRFFIELVEEGLVELVCGGCGVRSSANLDCNDAGQNMEAIVR